MNANKGLSTSCDRASSQISIYNYPAHLNPFHDDDNHKRLRFWNFSKRNDDSRRRSFSIGNLRDVWNFRSFTLKKKRSSTLGVQKTSESPPVLRRYLDSTTLHQNPGQHTARNRGLIRSLQNVNSHMEMELSRANGDPIYRGSGRYYRCLTPQLQQNHTLRSSYTSLSSTNPFETDIDSDCGSVTDAVVKKSMRKKRRAPLPPIRNVVGKPSAQEISKDTCQSPAEVEPNIDIKSLTVEIERFVNHTNEISTDITPALEPSLEPVAQNTDALETTSRTSEDNNNISSSEKVICKEEVPIKNMESLPTWENIDKEINVENANGNVMNTLGNISSNKISKRKHVNIAKEEMNGQGDIKPNISNVENLSTSEQTEKQQVLNVNRIPVLVTERNYPSTYNTLEKDTNNIISKQKHVSIEKEIEFSKEETLPIIPNEYCLTRCEQPASSNQFKVTDLSKQSTYYTLGKDSNNIVCKHEHINTITQNEISKEKILPNVVYLPTCEQLDKKLKVDNVNNNLIKVTDHRSYLGKNEMYKNNNIVESTEYFNEPLTILEKTETNTEGAQGRSKTSKPKSVKEIIDSINRSQKLLKESAAKGTHVYSTSLYLQDDKTNPIVDQNENSHKVCTNYISNGRLSLDNQVPLQPSFFQKSKINKEVFQCRESSPTASNLDWNPLPKPKRINSDSTK